MKYRRILPKVLLLSLAGIFLITAVHARPRSSVKNTVVREENINENGIITVTHRPPFYEGRPSAAFTECGDIR